VPCLDNHQAAAQLSSWRSLTQSLWGWGGWTLRLGLQVAAEPVRAAAASAAAAAFAETLVTGRFPRPMMRSFREGSSMARYMAARLVPLHKDPEEQQLARYPPFKLLDAAARQTVQAKFLYTVRSRGAVMLTQLDSYSTTLWASDSMSATARHPSSTGRAFRMRPSRC
jgi:hypothetical protein